MATDLRSALSKDSVGGIKVWALIGIIVGGLIIIILLLLLYCCLFSGKNFRRLKDRLPISQISTIFQEIKDIRVDHISTNDYAHHDAVLLRLKKKFNEKDFDGFRTNPTFETTKNEDSDNQSNSFTYLEEEVFKCQPHNDVATPQNMGICGPSCHPISVPSPLFGEVSHLGWGHWFTLRDLETATNRFSKDNVIGEGGYGVVYKGELVNGFPVAVKRLLNNLGQAEKEFKVEVEAIGHVRHKNLVRLLGYCTEGTHRLLVYEFVNNGNLEQWLHGAMQQHGYLIWEARMKVLIGTAKALSYLHEAIEPKVVHRDIKSSNILIDDEFNAKVSDFGLAKMLGSGKSHVTTRVMGTFGYVAPEYANSGLLNEKSDIYSFGVVLVEALTGRDRVDYTRPPNEVNLVDWLKLMVACRRSDEVVDPNIDTRPSTRTLKRVLLTALRCLDLNSERRPAMTQVVRMLESAEYPVAREERRHRRGRGSSGTAPPSLSGQR